MEAELLKNECYYPMTGFKVLVYYPMTGFKVLENITWGYGNHELKYWIYSQGAEGPEWVNSILSQFNDLKSLNLVPWDSQWFQVFFNTILLPMKTLENIWSRAHTKKQLLKKLM